MRGIEANTVLSKIEELQNKFTACEGEELALFTSMLDFACELTGSSSGFVAFVSYTICCEPQLCVRATKELSLSGSNVTDKEQIFESERQEELTYGNRFFQNLATEVLLTRQPVIYNDPYYWQHLPSCTDLQVHNFMALPLVFRGEIIAVMGLANTIENYCHQFIKSLSPFFNTCSLILSQLSCIKEAEAAPMYELAVSKAETIQSQELVKAFPTTNYLKERDQLLSTLNAVTLRESKLRDIVNNLNDVIWSASLDDSILYFVNDACAKLYGYAPSNFYTDRMLWFKVIHPQDAPRVLANHANLLRDGFLDHEYRIIMASGEVKWVVNRVWIVKDQQGIPIRMDGITKDATVRRKATEKLEDALAKEHNLNKQLLLHERELATQDEELRQVNQRLSVSVERLKKNEIALRKAQSLAKIGNFEWDVFSSEVVCSEEVHVILGKDLNSQCADKLLKTLVELTHPQDLQRLEAFIAKILSGKKSIAKLQYRIVSDTKEVKYLSICIDTIEKDPGGKVSRIYGIIQDVTSTVLSVHQIKEEKIRAELALWGGNLGLWDWDILNGRVTYNERWAEMLGYTLAEISPTVDAWTNLIHPDDVEEVFKLINAHFEGKTPFFQSEHRLKCKNGEWKWVQDSGKIMKWDASGKPLRVIGTHKDITSKKVAAEEVRKLALVAQKTENGVVITDANGLTDWVNEGFTRITGFMLEEIKGKKPGLLLQGPETDKATVAIMHEKISKGQEFHTEILNYSKTGEKYWLRLDVQPIIDHQGRLQQFIAIQTDITKRKQVEEQLYFQANILRNVKESVIVTDLQGKVIYYNQGAEALFGYSSQEMLGNELVALYHELPSPEERKKTWETLRSGKSFTGEWLGKNKNNQLVWVDVTTTLFLNELGEPVGLIGVSKDITDRKNTEEELRRSEVYLQSIFDATIQAYYLLDNNYTIIKFNKTGAEAIKKRYGKELQIGDSMLTYSDPKALADFKKNVQKAFTGEKVLTSLELFYPNDKKMWFEVQYLPARNAQNEVYGVAFVSLDITQRKLTEIALLKSYQEVQNFRNALNASALISLTDTKGNIIEVNDTFCKVSKYSKEELIGANHRIINSGYHSKEFFSGLWKTITAGKSWKGEIKNKAKDGSYYWIDTSITPVLDENGQIVQYLSVRYLISERKKAEEDREILVKNLTKFAFMTAHNLRGPLARILGLVSILNLDNPADPLNHMAIEKLKLSAQELDAVIFKMIEMVNLSDLK